MLPKRGFISSLRNCAVRPASPNATAKRAGRSKEFLESGKRRLAGDIAREGTSDEVKALRAEARQLKEALAEATLENRLLKSAIGDGEDAA
jgi:transposase